MTDVTRILNAIEAGDARAADELLPLVYEELRLLAAQRLSQERPGLTLQATALVHEAYLRLVGSENPGWDCRGHFFAAAAEAMRRILIEDARRKKHQRHGGRHSRVTLDESLASKNEKMAPEDLLALNDALQKLESEDKTKADLVKLRFFAGLTGEQAAKALGISHATAERYWAYARSWLRLEVMGHEA
ncbi:MAG: ECF-type sigma factor [Sedimentisphaerales bacterium]|jgi:RNA polymerase sigma factor (TIGR02999 family)